MTRADEIVEEIRRHREAHAASLDYDLKRITEDLQRQEAVGKEHRMQRKERQIGEHGRRRGHGGALSVKARMRAS